MRKLVLNLLKVKRVMRVRIIKFVKLDMFFS